MLDRNNNIELSTGEYGIYNEDIRDISKLAIINPNYVAWKTGVLIFNDTPLVEVLNTISDVFNVNIMNELKQEELSTLYLTAKFNNKSVNDIAGIIGYTLNINISLTNSDWIITSQR